ncbi:LysR family transcriptional regulator [Microvirga sp. BT291]|nr:LysR family transcriptional regulator [Microvirga pudoricolor]
MKIPRRFLPTTALLSAFEAAARTGSFTAAANELDLSQSAVSRQIRALEDQLGVELFVRERQTVRLTHAGEFYAREIGDALRKISTASLNLRANPNGGTLSLAILPTFGTRWLAPRLSRFLEAHPGITINLATRIQSFDFKRESFDAAVHFGNADWPGAESAFLMKERVIPACSPDLARQFGFKTPEDLRAAPLLHLASRPDAWERWFRANGTSDEGVHGMMFDQFATAAQAAMAGLGVALLPIFLMQSELSRGELVPALDRPLESAERYYLMWPLERALYPPLVAFRDWLVREAAGEAT